MKKMKSIMTLGVFLMAFFVFGLQNANAQYQSATNAAETLKLEYTTMTTSSLPMVASSNSQIAIVNSMLNYRATKGFILRVLNAFNEGETTTSTAINSVYNDLLTGANGDALRIAMLDASKEYIQDLVQD